VIIAFLWKLLKKSSKRLKTVSKSYSPVSCTRLRPDCRSSSSDGIYIMEHYFNHIIIMNKMYILLKYMEQQQALLLTRTSINTHICTPRTYTHSLYDHDFSYSQQHLNIFKMKQKYGSNIDKGWCWCFLFHIQMSVSLWGNIYFTPITLIHMIDTLSISHHNQKKFKCCMIEFT